MVGLEYTVTGKQATPLAESTVVPFPLNLPRAGFRIGQTGSVIDPARDVVEGANRFLWCVDEWLDASDDRVGLGIRPVDMPLVSIGDVGIYRFDPYRRPEGSTVYSHLSNTQWGTNFPQWLEGSFRWRIDLRPHARDWREGFAGARNPRILQYAGVVPPVMMSTARLLALTRQDLVTIAVRPRHDGPGLIMRLADRCGYPREEVLYFSSYLPEAAYKRISSVWLCDTMERPVEKLGHYMAGWPDSLKVKVGAFSVITLLVEFEGGGSSDE
jgi:hypothetical protein